MGKFAREDKWVFDPLKKKKNQHYLRWSYREKDYDRGHQIPSADRTANEETNVKTFISTNSTPQRRYLNQRGWTDFEQFVRDMTKTSDTLYVVTGAILKTVGGNESVGTATDNNGKKVPVPNYYYKVLLQKSNGVGNVHGYKAIGFWVPNKDLPKGVDKSKYAKSVSEIEKLTGFDFFPNLTNSENNLGITPEQAKEIESTYNRVAWGL